jgi:hypothetical protein
MRIRGRIIRIAALPTMHLCLSAWAAASHDAWNWILLAGLDLPLVYIQSYFMNRFNLGLVSPCGLTIFGTLWWLSIGVALSYFFEWFVRICVVRAQKEDEGTRHGN